MVNLRDTTALVSLILPFTADAIHSLLRILHSRWGHATIWPVKAAIRLLVRFLFWFALVVLTTSALVVAHRYVTGFDPAGTTASGSFLDRFLHGMSLVWIPAILFAGVIALFSALRSMQASLGGIAGLFVAWTALLLAGGYLIPALPSEIATTIVLPEQALVRVPRYRLYAIAREANTLSPLIIYDEEQAGNTGFAVRPEARIDPGTGHLIVAGMDERTVDLTRAANSFPAMVREPELTAGFTRDVTDLARLLSVEAGGPVTSLLNLLSLSLFLLGCWTLVRLTRWPLFNAVFTLAAIRFAVWIVPAVHVGALRGTLIAGFDSTALPYASAAILGAFALGLFATLVFLPPLREWHRGVDHG